MTSAELISDLVPTFSDDRTRVDMSVLRALVMTDDTDDVWAEPTLELYVDDEPTR